MRFRRDRVHVSDTEIKERAGPPLVQHQPNVVWMGRVFIWRRGATVLRRYNRPA